MSPRIHFLGNAAACARWLPFAKSKLAELTKRYANRPHWTRELPVPGALVSLERAGGVSYIRIRAGGFGYEFATALERQEGGDYASAFYDLRFTTAKSKAGAGQSNGLPPSDPDGGFDSYIFGGKWDEFVSDGVPYAYPTMDWFGVAPPVDSQDQELRKRKGFGKAAYAVTTPSNVGRHKNAIGIYARMNGGVMLGSAYGTVMEDHLGYRGGVGPVILHKKNGKPRVLDELGVNCYSAAVQGKYLVGSQGYGEQYQFFAYDLETGTYYPADLSFFRPEWLFGQSQTSWFWNGAGNRAISLQYDIASHLADAEDKATSSTPQVEVTIHEIEFEAKRAVESGELELLTATTFAKRTLPIHPVAVDYDLIDGVTRRVLVLEPWIGPLFSRIPTFSTWYSDLPGQEQKCRSLLVYAHLCTVDDQGNVSEPTATFPLYHRPWLCAIPDTNGNDPDVDEFGYSAAYNGTALGAQEFYERFGNHGFVSRIAALDVRAQAIALYSQVQTELYPENTQNWTDVEYQLEHNRRWSIWGEPTPRENRWMDHDGNEFTPSVDPIDDLLTPPADYSRYVPEHPFWQLNIIARDINPVYEEIVRNLYALEAPASVYDGFHVSPKKHFSLYVHAGSWFFVDHEPGPIRGQITEIPDQVKPFIHFDHVEWFGLDENDAPDPITSTHAELFNAARGESFERSGDEIESFCTNGLWWWY